MKEETFGPARAMSKSLYHIINIIISLYCKIHHYKLIRFVAIVNSLDILQFSVARDSIRDATCYLYFHVSTCQRGKNLEEVEGKSSIIVGQFLPSAEIDN